MAPFLFRSWRADIVAKAKKRVANACEQLRLMPTMRQVKTTVGTKGKLQPAYRDPKTGATWSGHARPPQWIANVKDRSKFLIVGETDGAAAGAASNTKAAVATKKTAGKQAASANAAANKASAKSAVKKCNAVFPDLRFNNRIHASSCPLKRER